MTDSNNWEKDKRRNSKSVNGINVTVYVIKKDLALILQLVNDGFFLNRTEAMRIAVREFSERQRIIHYTDLNPPAQEIVFKPKIIEGAKK